MSDTLNHAVVKVGIDALAVGRPLKCPIHDANGTLLLAAGVTLTTEFKERLKLRCVQFVLAHQDDLLPDKSPQTTASEDQPDPGDSEPQGNSERKEKSAGVLGSGRMSVKNSGPAIRDKRVVHGRKAYDPGLRENLISQTESTCTLIETMMKNVPQRGSLNGDQMISVASNLLADLLADADNVLTISLDLDTAQHGLAEHCRQMSLLGMSLGMEMELDEENVRIIGTAGLLHDWGMIHVPEQIRRLERVPSPLELLKIKKHPTDTWDMLEGMLEISPLVRLICYQVHERPNGMGYPRGRSGDSIHSFAKILHVAHLYTALTSPKPYRAPYMPYIAMEYLLKQANVHSVDPMMVRSLLNIVSLFPIGSFVELSDGSSARVLRQNRDHYMSPVVQIVCDSAENSIDSDDAAVIDLISSDLQVSQPLPSPDRNEIAISPTLDNLDFIY